MSNEVRRLLMDYTFVVQATVGAIAQMFRYENECNTL
jgi:hypothetical protein